MKGVVAFCSHFFLSGVEFEVHIRRRTRRTTGCAFLSPNRLCWFFFPQVNIAKYFFLALELSWRFGSHNFSSSESPCAESDLCLSDCIVTRLIKCQKLLGDLFLSPQALFFCSLCHVFFVEPNVRCSVACNRWWRRCHSSTASGHKCTFLFAFFFFLVETPAGKKHR